MDAQTAAIGVVDIGILVFREGLECLLVLITITAGMRGDDRTHRRPIAVGVAVGLMASVLTWFVIVGTLTRMAAIVDPLAVQAATGLLAIVVLLVVMNWFFHKLYWTGWIGLHTRRKRELLQNRNAARSAPSRLFVGLALLGFTSLYREGVEVDLFLQSYRMQLGGRVVLAGLGIGLALIAVVGVLGFVGHRRLPYRKMLIVTGVLLGVVLLVMVGEEAQEMQLAHWLPVTTIPALVRIFPSWTGQWFSLFPNVQSLIAQGAAGLAVVGSYVVARTKTQRNVGSPSI